MLGAKPAPPKDGVACIVAATAQMGIGRDGNQSFLSAAGEPEGRHGLLFKRVTTEAPEAPRNRTPS